ncbi:MAG: histidine kinase, partial [Bacteroidota bacterium]
TELKFLKAQLNPHFLFNTLNNLYAQVITRSGKAPAMILQLSGILDYVLYQSQQKAVPLAEEVAVIKDFIAIEAIRYGARLKVEFSVAGSLTIAVPPLLFLSLVENAFKHGVSKGIDGARVKIEIREHRGEVSCKVWNTKSDFQPVRRDDHRKGLGLSNVKRQLTISHPDAHSLQIAEEATAFCVTVVIK